ncbi:MAG: thiamine pyrophosphate-binding protein, partial [Muricoprocola sp.]
MKLNGSQILIECLKEQGVDTVFGYPGGAILNIYDELYKHSDEITHILTSHEQGASHAADGYARATGKVGVCLATSGPGATNLVTGIATAYMDSVPMVAITANVGVPLLGKDSFQEIDITGVTMPITKHNYIVKDVDKLADTIRNAFTIAKEGRPGPVLIDIPKDVTAAVTEYTPAVPEPIERKTDYVRECDLDEAVELINKCKRPFVLVGGGAIISDAEAELKEFVEKIDACVGDTLMGKGAFDGRSDRYTGMAGMHGTKTSNLGITQCDLLIAIGMRFSDRIVGNAKRFANKSKIIHIDIDAAEINKNIQVDCSIQGDAREVLKRLNAKIEKHDHLEWMKNIHDLKERFPLKYDGDRLTGPAVIEEIYEATKG